MSTPRTADHPIQAQFTERWSPRAFTGEALPLATLQSIFEAARWAPSAFNAQPWRFVYGIAGTPAFATLLDALLPFNQTWARNAGALVAVISATQFTAPGKTEAQPLPSHSFDTGSAWALLALQSQALGWHTHGMGGFDRDRLRAALAVPEGFALEAMVAIGRQAPADTLPEPLRAREQPSARNPQDRFVAEGRFGFEA